MIDWKLIVNKYVKGLINSIVAGVLISLGAICYLVCLGQGQQVFGSLIFSLGFLFIALYGYDYFTGKSGYVAENKVPYILDLVVMVLGNYIGAWLVSLVVLMTDMTEATSSLMLGLNMVMATKIGEGMVFSLFGKSLLSGIIIYFVFNTYKKAEQPIARFLSLFIGGAVICIVGLDELVTNMFYSNLYCLVEGNYGDLALKLLYVLIGNTLGTIMIPLVRKLRGKLRSI